MEDRGALAEPLKLPINLEVVAAEIPLVGLADVTPGILLMLVLLLMRVEPRDIVAETPLDAALEVREPTLRLPEVVRASELVPVGVGAKLFPVADDTRPIELDRERFGTPVVVSTPLMEAELLAELRLTPLEVARIGDAEEDPKVVTPLMRLLPTLPAEEVIWLCNDIDEEMTPDDWMLIGPDCEIPVTETEVIEGFTPLPESVLAVSGVDPVNDVDESSVASSLVVSGNCWPVRDPPLMLKFGIRYDGEVLKLTLWLDKLSVDIGVTITPLIDVDNMLSVPKLSETMTLGGAGDRMVEFPENDVETTPEIADVGELKELLADTCEDNDGR